MAARTFRDLVIWQKSHKLVLEVYRATRHFPDDERYGLTRQLRRSAVSVPANIAEGFVKRGTPDKLRYFNIAQGSLEESRYYLILASDLGIADVSDLHRQVEDCSRALESYVGTIHRSMRS